MVVAVKSKARTHQGGVAAEDIAAKEQLTRAASSCMLFEDTFYEKGSDIARRIAELVEKCSPEDVAAIARMCKNDMKLRHVPLWLAVQMAIKHAGKRGARALIRSLVADVVQRPDELAEIIALYFRAAEDRGKTRKVGQNERKSPLPHALSEGVADAFTKFSEYSLAKWNRTDREIKLKDALFLTHPKAKDADQDALWKRLVADTLETPATWEVALSTLTNPETGEKFADKRAAWSWLLGNNKLGAMALLMNLRNMTEAGIDRALVREALGRIDGRSKLLPFRFVAAAQFAPEYADELSEAMLRAVADLKKLGGTTVLVVDNSGSMHGATISERSKMDRSAAAGALAILLREVSDDARVFVYGTSVAEVKNVRGLPLIDAVRNGPGGGTATAAALKFAKSKVPDATRVILITDEQASDGIVENWGEKQGYVVNVAPYAPGLDMTRNGWQRINGWSERLVDWVAFEESGSVGDAEEPE